MKHVMLDAYGSEGTQLNNMLHINNLLNEVALQLDLEPIMPPQLIPYYYGRVKEDVGVSSFMLLKGGHLTIHTFPVRECYFVDCVSEKDFDEKKFYDVFFDKLHFVKNKSIYQSTNRNTDKPRMEKYSPEIDFGPHYMAKIKVKEKPTMEYMFDFLENLVNRINMDEITRATVLKDNTINPSFYSAIIIIAQSHISIHYSFKENCIYADCFSCAPFDFSTLNSCFSELGEVIISELIPRGTKHLSKIRMREEEERLLASTIWQKTIKD